MEGRILVPNPSGQGRTYDFRHGVYFNATSGQIFTCQEEGRREILMDSAEIHQVFRRYADDANLATQAQERPKRQRLGFDLQTDRR